MKYIQHHSKETYRPNLTTLPKRRIGLTHWMLKRGVPYKSRLALIRIESLQQNRLLGHHIREVPPLVPVRMPNGEEIMLPKKKVMLMGLVHDGLSGTPKQRRDAIALLREQRFFDLKPSDAPKNAKEREQALADLICTLAKEAERAGHTIDWPEPRP